jgi:hypothetical protein
LGPAWKVFEDDTIAMDLAVLDNDVAEVHSHPECDPFFLRCPGIAFDHASLPRNRAGDGLDYPREVDQNAVPGRLDDAPAMFANFGVDQFAPMRLHLRERAFLVGAHEPAVPRDVRGENGGQPALDAFRGQSGTP